MKKVILFFAVATVVALASCGGGQTKAPEVVPEEEGIEVVTSQEGIDEVSAEVADSSAVVAPEEAGE